MKTAFSKKSLCFGLALAALAFPALADAPAGNWMGPYIGGHFGYGWGDFNSHNGVAGPDGSYDDLMGGAQIGNNLQYDHIVLGIEGDGSALNIESRNGGATFREDWMATGRVRLGYALDQILPYVTGGVGFTDIVSRAPGLGEDSRVEAGAVGGGGIDFMLPPMNNGEASKWFGRIEYLYADVPRDHTYVGGTRVAGGSGNNMLRVGLNYRFP